MYYYFALIFFIFIDGDEIEEKFQFSKHAIKQKYKEMIPSPAMYSHCSMYAPINYGTWTSACASHTHYKARAPTKKLSLPPGPTKHTLGWTK